MRSALDQTVLPDEIVVVDASSTAHTHKAIQELGSPTVPITYVRERPGLPLQRNAAIRATKCELIQFIDDDVELFPDYVELLLRIVGEAPPGVVAFQGRLLEPSDRLGVKSRRFRRLLTSLLSRVFLLPTNGRGRIKLSGFGQTPRGFRSPAPVEVVNGCACFRREVFEAVSFDERLTSYAWMEDIDMARQLKALGLRCLHVPQARFLHNHTPTARLSGAELGTMQVENHRYLYLKHSRRTVPERVTFWWSLVGLVVVSVVNGDFARARGLLRGIRSLV